MADGSDVLDFVPPMNEQLQDPLPAATRAAPPELPRDAICFRPVDPIEPGAVIGELTRSLAGLRQHKSINPFSNAVQLLGIELKRRLDAGELSFSALEQVIQRLTTDSFVRRSDRVRGYLGEVERGANEATIRALILGLTRDPATGAMVPFETFRRAVERDRFGIVITAHPTFSLAKDLQAILIELALGVDAAGQPLDAARRRALIDSVAHAEHRPDRPLDLDEEHRQSLAAIANLRTVLRQAYRLVYEVAEAVYPERWTELNPRLVTIASWVGYDLDGRFDIPWSTTFAKRLRVQVLQLQRYAAEARALRAAVDGLSPVGDLLDLLATRLALAIKQAEDEVEIFAQRPPEDDARPWRAQIARAARAMHAGREQRLVDPAPLLHLIERAIAASDDPALRRGLLVLRAEMRTHGLGLAHTHTRLNARQLHNAIRKTIQVDHSPDDPSHRLSYLNAISAAIEQVEPTRINFGSVLAEKATARRIVMVIAQILKYVDATQPIRFLIAECETGFTLLTALYFAKLFGVEDKIEISPLFESLTGLEQGGRVVAEALGVASYRDYIRRQGRLCIQTGYSDAGRALGQIAAANAIEQLRRAVGKELAAQGLAEVELVIFDTHGEAIGRGGHPGGFADRLAYVDTPVSRREFAALGIAHKQEVSFQGGDGYLHFLTEASAFAALTRMLEHALTPPDLAEDRFYIETGYVQEFFSVIQRFNQQIMDDPSYGALLSAYGPNMLHRAGSRPVKRQFDSWSGQIKLEHPSALRAIPHNAILQQLGFLANSIGGVGQAVAKDPARFQRLYEDSARFRRLMTMVEHAFKYSDLAVLKAYIDLFDPGLWLIQVARDEDEARTEALTRIAAIMERMGLHQRLIRIWRQFMRDYILLAGAFREHRRRRRDAGAEPIAVDAASRDIMHQLHAVRLVLIQEVYLLSIRVPEFSGRHEITHDSMIARLIQLDVESALAKLNEIFPFTFETAEDEDFGEPATYRSADTQSYVQLHAEIFRPLGQLYTLIRRISAAVTHNVGAHG
jgi:phosphoenolpyruvate carboxylase